MFVEEIEGLEGIRALRRPWEEAYRCDSRASLFVSWPWTCALAEKTPYRWSVVVARQRPQAEPVAFLPVVESRKVWLPPKGQACLNIGGMPNANRGGFVCRAGLEPDAIPALAHHLQKHKRWQELRLAHVSGARVDDFLACFGGRRYRVTHEIPQSCPCIDLPNQWDTYLKECLSAKGRYHLKRSLREIEAQKGLRVTGGVRGDLESSMEQLLQLWQGRWGEKSESRLHELRAIMLAAGQAERLWIRLFWVRNDPIAGLAGFVDPVRGSFYCFMTGFNQDYSHLAPGKALFGYAIREAIQLGLERFDIGIGRAEYKLSRLGADDHYLRNAVINRRVGAAPTWIPRRGGNVRAHPMSGAPRAETVFAPGQIVRVRSAAEIAATLDENGLLDGCAFRRPMARYCGRTLRVLRPVERYFDEARWRMLACRDVVLLGGGICDGSGLSNGTQCDRACLFFWKTAWLQPIEPTESGSHDGLNPVESDWALQGGAEFAEPGPETEGPDPDKVAIFSLPCQCQLQLGGAGASEPWLWTVARRTRLGALAHRARLVRGVRRRLRRIAARARHQIRGIRPSKAALTSTKPSTKRATVSTTSSPQELASGDWVRVRTLAEIKETLDGEHRCGGCFFMTSMYRFSGQNLRVIRPVHRFFDEAKGRVVRCKHTVLLEGAHCDGTGSLDTDGCDRMCYYVWRTEWLEPCKPDRLFSRHRAGDGPA